MTTIEKVERSRGTISTKNAAVRSTGTTLGTIQKTTANTMKKKNKGWNGNRNEHSKKVHRSVPPQSLGGVGGNFKALSALKREILAELKATFRKSDDPNPKLRRASLTWQLQAVEKKLARRK